MLAVWEKDKLIDLTKLCCQDFLKLGAPYWRPEGVFMVVPQSISGTFPDVVIKEKEIGPINRCPFCGEKIVVAQVVSQSSNTKVNNDEG